MYTLRILRRTSRSKRLFIICFCLLGVGCITEHAKFRIVCLDTDVLNTALVAIHNIRCNPGKLYCIFCVSVFIIWRWSTKRWNNIRSQKKITFNRQPTSRLTCANSGKIILAAEPPSSEEKCRLVLSCHLFTPAEEYGKAIWSARKRLGRREEKWPVAVRFSFFLPLIHLELIKSFPSITAHTEKRPGRSLGKVTFPSLFFNSSIHSPREMPSPPLKIFPELAQVNLLAG